MNPPPPGGQEKGSSPYSSSHPSESQNGFQAFSSSAPFQSDSRFPNTTQYNAQPNTMQYNAQYQAQMAHLAQGYGQQPQQQAYQQPWSEGQSYTNYSTYYSQNQYSRNDRDTSTSIYSSQPNQHYGYYHGAQSGQPNTAFQAPPTAYTNYSNYNDLIKQYQASQGYSVSTPAEGEKGNSSLKSNESGIQQQQGGHEHYQYYQSSQTQPPPPSSNSSSYFNQQHNSSSNYSNQNQTSKNNSTVSVRDDNSFGTKHSERNLGNKPLDQREGYETHEREKRQRESRWDSRNNAQKQGSFMSKSETLEKSSNSEGSQYPPSLVEYVNKCVIPHKKDKAKVSSIQEQLSELINKHKHEIYTFPWHELPILQPFRNIDSYGKNNPTKGQKQWLGFQNQNKKRGLLSSETGKSSVIVREDSNENRGSNFSAPRKQKIVNNSEVYGMNNDTNFSNTTNMLSDKEREKLERRSKRFSVSQSQDTRRMKIDPSEESSRSFSFSESSSKKFGKKRKANELELEIDHNIIHTPSEEQKPIVGTCMTMYKEYVRATDIPDPSEIRPAHILQKWLNHLKGKWEEGTGYKWDSSGILQNDLSPKILTYTSILNVVSDPERKKKLSSDYDFMLSQLKAIRNDMNAQRIEGLLYIDLYETHAKIALQCGDTNEFNICQTKLNEAYNESMVGSERTHFEFLYYRLLYCIFEDSNSVLKIMNSLTKEEKAHLWIRFALKIRETLATRNYHLFFLLFLRAPGMGKFLIQQYINRERVKALRLIIACFRPTVHIDFLAKELGFGEGIINDDALDQCKDFCSSVGCKFVTENTELDCKNSLLDPSKI